MAAPATAVRPVSAPSAPRVPTSACASWAAWGSRACGGAKAQGCSVGCDYCMTDPKHPNNNGSIPTKAINGNSPHADKASFRKSYYENPKTKAVLLKVRKTPRWPRSWANYSLLQLYSNCNAWANLHILGQPNTFLACIFWANLTPLCKTEGVLDDERARGRRRGQ